MAYGWDLCQSLKIVAVFSSVCIASSFNEAKFRELVDKMESDVLALADEVERVFAMRCEQSTYVECLRSNYDDCVAEYPNQECLGGLDFIIPQCSGEDAIKKNVTPVCSGRYSREVSSLRIASSIKRGAHNEPADPDAIEAICTTRRLDRWFRDRTEKFREYWKSFGVEPPSYYFGSTTGILRIFPARHSKVCGSYDHRIRSWYVAGSSGPKNLVLVIDTSGSMANHDRIGFVKRAAKRIVQTLTVSDRIAIIPFSSDTAQAVTDDGRMFLATDENKKLLIDAIDKFTAANSTNFEAAFSHAFKTFHETIDHEDHLGCTSAILFLTDGERTAGAELPEVTSLVTSQVSNISARLGRPVVLFTYSVGGTSSNVHKYPAELACAVEKGVWTEVTHSGDILGALSSYYQLFAVGLGSSANRKPAWVEPYEYETNGLWGTTVSVPVYDRSKSPPIFLGVAAVDFSMLPMEVALGGDNAQEALRSVIDKSQLDCPEGFNLTKCELQSWSLKSDESAREFQCDVNCTVRGVQFENELCEGISRPPAVLKNHVQEGNTYHQRVCCRVDAAELFPLNPGCCPADPEECITVPPEPVWVLLVPLVLLVLLVLLAWCFVSDAMRREPPVTVPPRSASAPTETLSVSIPSPSNNDALAPLAQTERTSRRESSTDEMAPIPHPTNGASTPVFSETTSANGSEDEELAGPEVASTDGSEEAGSAGGSTHGSEGEESVSDHDAWLQRTIRFQLLAPPPVNNLSPV